MTDHTTDLPGMWEPADFTGGAADHTTDPTPAPDATCHAWRPWGDAELSCALAAGHQGHHDDGEGRTWTDAQAEQEARDDDSGETPIPGTGYRWPTTDPTPTADPARLDLAQIEQRANAATPAPWQVTNGNEGTERERDSLARRCALRYEENEKLRAELSGLREQLDNARGWSDLKDGELAGASAQRDEARAEAARLRAELSLVERQRDRLAAERNELRARVAELEQALHEAANLAATTPVNEPATAIDRLGEIVRRAQQGIRDRWRVSATQMAAGYEPPSMSLSPAKLEQPGRWELPAEPGPEVTQVWDGNGRRWYRHDSPAGHGWRSGSPETGFRYRHWADLLYDGPLSATPPETAERTVDHCLPCGGPLIVRDGRRVHQANGERTCPSPVTAGGGQA